MNKPTEKRATTSAEDYPELGARFLGRLDSLVRLRLRIICHYAPIHRILHGRVLLATQHDIVAVAPVFQILAGMVRAEYMGRFRLPRGPPAYHSICMFCTPVCFCRLTNRICSFISPEVNNDRLAETVFISRDWRIFS